MDFRRFKCQAFLSRCMYPETRQTKFCVYKKTRKCIFFLVVSRPEDVDIFCISVFFGLVIVMLRGQDFIYLRYI